MMRVSGFALLAVASLSLPSAPVLAQDVRLESRLDARTYAAVRPVIDSARAAGLPTEPLVQKALEGTAKRADGPRIALAVRGVARDLRAARGALGVAAGEAELVAGAGAIRAGVSPATIARLRSLRPSEPLTVALAVLADLIARGVPTDTAAGAVMTLASGGATDESFVVYQRTVERDIGVGTPPATAAAIRVRNVPLTPLPTRQQPPAGTLGQGDPRTKP